MNNEIAFLDRVVRLQELQQILTYEGLLEGLPTKEMNKHLIERVLQEPSNQIYETPPYLVKPVEVPLDYEYNGSPYPFGTPAHLPSVLCVGRLVSFSPTMGSSCYASGLVVVWFQDNFALPIDEEVLLHLSLTEWNKFARSFDL